MGLKPNGNAAAAANQEAARLQHDASIDVANIQSNTALAGATIAGQHATEAARISSEAALQSAHAIAAGSAHAAGIAAEGAAHAAGISADATRYASDRIFETAEQAAERSRVAGEEALVYQDEQFALANERLQPYADLGNGATEYLANAATLDGFLGNLAAISETSAYQDLYDDRFRDAQSILAQNGLSRSGAAAQSAADIGTDLRIGIDGQMYDRNAANAAAGYAASSQQNQLGTQYANAAGNILTGTAAVQGAGLNTAAANAGQIQVAGANAQGQFIANGANQAAGYVAQGAQAQGNGIYQAGQATANGVYQTGQFMANGLTQAAYYTGQGMMGAANATANGMVNGANAQYQTDQNNFNNTMAIGATIASFFSDPRLKENMQPIGKVGRLTWYEWDWKEFARGVSGTEMGTGYNAEEVKELYPQHVADINGILTVNYPALNNEIRQELELAA